MINSNTPNNSDSQNKSKAPIKQLQTIFLYFSKNVATASEAAEHTGIKQKNICRYKSDLQKRGLLKELYKAPCRVTGFKAYFLTTDPSKFPADPQMKLL